MATEVISDIQSEKLQKLRDNTRKLQNSWDNSEKFTKMVDKPPQKE